MGKRKIIIGIIILLLLVPAVSFSEVICKRINKDNGYERVFYESNNEIAKQIYDENNYLIKKTGKIPDGVVKWYDKNGKLEAERNYKDGKLEGMSKEYNENGEIVIIDIYKKGHKINLNELYKIEKLITDQNYSYPEEEVFNNEGIKQVLSDTLRTSFFKTGKFTVLERTKMDAILKEQKFQLTGCTTTECAIEIGKILNVNYMVISSIGKVAKEYVVNIRIVNVESSEVVIADMERSNSEKELIDVIDKLVVNISNKISLKDDNTKLKSTHSIHSGLILSGAEVSIAILDIDVK